MRIFEEDPRIIELDDIRQGLLIGQKGWLARIFNPVFNAGIIPAPQRQVIGNKTEIIPYLEYMFSEDDDYWEHALKANCINGEIKVPEILLKKQAAFRERRDERSPGLPRFALHHFGWTQEFIEVANIMADFARYVRPVMGKYYAVSILNKYGRRSVEEEMHRDGNGGVKNYRVISMPIHENDPATVIKKKDGSLIRPAAGSAVIVDDTLEHSTDEHGKFRPILLAHTTPKPSLF
ncbi:MAG: hypothetical protein DI586_01705 [Micavibrio aeruginosavorus]|uniref:Uncharacterized protein n=1 Tax=Micavibrio aeruginosavorus TaxID=349221 RepID=A0A2W5HN02_9BACT|nr:MAG: hypothetical protein DI586_01705 [Micavibrio aeruginosavorus]